jgi:hypothetical protein
VRFCRRESANEQEGGVQWFFVVDARLSLSRPFFADYLQRPALLWAPTSVHNRTGR